MTLYEPCCGLRVAGCGAAELRHRAIVRPSLNSQWHPQDVDTKIGDPSANPWARISAIAMVLLFLLLGVVTLLQSNADQVSGVGYLAMAIGALGLLLGELGQQPLASKPRRVFMGVKVLLAASIVLIAFWQAIR